MLWRCRNADLRTSNRSLYLEAADPSVEDGSWLTRFLGSTCDSARSTSIHAQDIRFGGCSYVGFVCSDGLERPIEKASAHDDLSV